MSVGIIIITLVAIVAGTMSKVLRVWLTRRRGAALPQSDLNQIRDGIGQLQQSVDAIALEVERLSEGQRFTTKLLAQQQSEVVQTPPAVRQG